MIIAALLGVKLRKAPWDGAQMGFPWDRCSLGHLPLQNVGDETEPQSAFSTKVNTSTGSAEQQEIHTQGSTEALYSLSAITESQGQDCPRWQILFPLGCVYRTSY